MNPLQIEKIYNKQDGAEVACWAHNPKVTGSNPVSATGYHTAILFINSTQNRMPCGLESHLMRTHLREAFATPARC